MILKTQIEQLLGVTAAIIGAVLLVACQSSTTAPVPTSPATAAVIWTLTEAPGLQTYALPTATPLVLEGATITDSGLQFLEITPGDGVSPKPGDLITMHYIATLPDGTELANSYTEAQPYTTVWGRGRLLPGWEEGIGLMKVNGKAKLLLPPGLGFGAEGAGAVPSNSQVIIEVELLSAKPAPSPAMVAEDKLVKTASGLQYYDLIVGTGTEALQNYTVFTHYTLWVKTDSGYDYIVSSTDGSAVQFVLGRGDTVFPGWEEGTAGMKAGGKRLLVIPPELGMGAEGLGVIPANAELVMEIDLADAREPREPVKVDEANYTTTSSGLKYYDLVLGTGDTPVAGQTVVVHYTGWLEDGTLFDSSIDRGEPFNFKLGDGSVIPGWEEGISMMKVGGKRQLVIPADLGYGASGAGSVIPPNATLIFEVELLRIQP
jgi:peptidylprolyl isomerase